MSLVLTIDDLRDRARRRMPAVVFDYIDGGVEDELALARNTDAFRRWSFVPRYLRDVAQRRTERTLWGRTYDLPFGIAPTGFAGLFRPGADLMLARAASAAGVPFVVSGASNASIEAVADVMETPPWFQIYCSRDQQITRDLLVRAERAGVETLVVTVDVPVTPKRTRNLRNGFGLPPRLSFRTMLDAAMHPAWTFGYFANGGMPALGNWAPYAPEGSRALSVARLFAAETPDPSHDWRQVETLRALWPGRLVVKGLMHVDDARQAQALGADAIWVSNHGGRQLDRVPPSLEMLPLMRKALGPDMPIFLDSGVRRGADIATALCLGADFVFAGRPTLYGVAAMGERGAARALAILAEELDLILAQIGCADIAALGPDCIVSHSSRTEILEA